MQFFQNIVCWFSVDNFYHEHEIFNDGYMFCPMVLEEAFCNSHLKFSQYWTMDQLWLQNLGLALFCLSLRLSLILNYPVSVHIYLPFHIYSSIWLKSTSVNSVGFSCQFCLHEQKNVIHVVDYPFGHLFTFTCIQCILHGSLSIYQSVFIVYSYVLPGIYMYVYVTTSCSKI